MKHAALLLVATLALASALRRPMVGTSTRALLSRPSSAHRLERLLAVIPSEPDEIDEYTEAKIPAQVLLPAAEVMAFILSALALTALAALSTFVLLNPSGLEQLPDTFMNSGWLLSPGIGF